MHSGWILPGSSGAYSHQSCMCNEFIPFWRDDRQLERASQVAMEGHSVSRSIVVREAGRIGGRRLEARFGM